MDIITVSKDTERMIFSSYVSDDINCAQAVIDNYYWIVEFLVSKFTKLGSSKEQLEDIAYDALLFSASEFRLDSGVHFGEYAVRNIREKIYNAILDEAMINHRTSFVTNALIKLKSATNIVGNNITNNSTDWKVAQALGIDEDVLIDIVYGPPAISGEELSDISRQGLDKLKQTPGHLSRKFIKSASKSFDDILQSFSDE